MFTQLTKTKNKRGLKAMSINDVKKNRGKVSKRPAEAELSAMYQEKTAKEIAHHYGVADSTVRAWIAYYRKQSKERTKC